MEIANLFLLHLYTLKVLQGFALPGQRGEEPLLTQTAKLSCECDTRGFSSF